MNKFGIVLGVAAVATLAGCKDPDYKHANAPTAQDEVKNADTETVVVEKPIEIKKCTCAPGTKHTSPCQCGAPDCQCIVETKPIIVADVSKPVVVAPPKPVEPEYTVYIVQRGDYLAKISKKFNVTIASIKRLNPSIKKDIVRVGQKLKLPGKFDVGVQEKPVAKAAAPVKAAKKGFVAYAGATTEYVVKNGDTLGSIAYGNGCNIRQLKELNGLTKDSIRVGQKLKVPVGKATVAEKKDANKKTVVKKDAAPKAAAAPVAAVAAPAAPAPAAEPAAAPVPESASAAEAAPAPAAPAAAEEAAPAAQPAAPAAAAEAAPATTTYVVAAGDDMTGVSIRWGVSAAEIRELNNLGDNDQLVPGQIIKLPAEVQQ